MRSAGTHRTLHDAVKSLRLPADEDRDGATPQDWFRQGYRGSRFSFGYPACPNLEDQDLLFRLVDPSPIGVSLTDEFMLHPEQSTSAIVLHHPEATYFNARERTEDPAVDVDA